MQLFILLTAALALPGGSLSRPAAEWQHAASSASSVVHSGFSREALAGALALKDIDFSLPISEWEQAAASAVSTGVHSVILEDRAPGFLKSTRIKEKNLVPELLKSLRRGIAQILNKGLGNELHEIGEVAKAIPIYGDVVFPLNEYDADRWDKTLGAVHDIILNFKRFIPKTMKTIVSPNGFPVEEELGHLVQYVKESKLDTFGRVRKSTRKKARVAIAILIAFQHENDLAKGKIATSTSVLPEHARVKLMEMIEKDVSESLAKKKN